MGPVLTSLAPEYYRNDVKRLRPVIEQHLIEIDGWLFILPSCPEVASRAWKGLRSTGLFYGWLDER